MKKHFIILIGAIALVSCSEQAELKTENTQSSSFTFSKNRSVDDAWDIANQILSTNVTLRSGQSLKPAPEEYIKNKH